jgi:lipopolysaccharide heptosyltransferase II
MNILVIKLSSVGDVILITASLKALRSKFPSAQITCLTGPESQSVLDSCPYIDNLMVYDKNFNHKGTINFIKFALILKKCRFDKIIDLQNNKRSHILSFLSSPKDSYGFNNGKLSFLLSQPVKDFNKEIPAIEQQFQILNKLDIHYDSNTHLELWPTTKDSEYAKSLLNAYQIGEQDNIVGINIAASAEWGTKNWPVSSIAKLCDLLTADNIKVVITGMDKDKPDTEKLSSLTQSNPAIVAGKTNITQLAALIKKCKVFISPDSAPMHIASAMRTPFIAFFGPTSSLRHMPPAKKFIVLEKELDCAPCYSKYCRISTHSCLNDISPEEVYLGVKSLLAQ